MEAIIRAENDDEDEDEVPDDEVINNMIARSDDEFEIFQAIAYLQNRRFHCEL